VKTIQACLLTGFLATVVFNLGCDNNLLSETAKRDTPEAILFEAQELMNASRFSDAVAKIETLDAATLAQRDVTVLRASAYAGRCGLNFISLVNSLKNLSSTNTFLKALLSSMRTSSGFADCRTAEDLIESVGATGALRSEDENILLAVVSFAKLGSILAVTADADDNGAADAGFNACTGLSDNQAREIGSGISIALESLQGVSGIADSALSQINTVCGVVPVCSKTNPADYTALEILAIKTAVHDDNDIGLGTQPTTVCL